MNRTDINHIQIVGLHHQFYVDLTLKPGLNVLYGKNGKGKTTLLHILANFKELDFDRFRYLQFKRIEITTYGGDNFIIEREIFPGDVVGIRVQLNGLRLGGDGPTTTLSSSEKSALSDIVGGRPVYLPAFRAILERVRADAYVPSTSRDAEFDRIREEERQIAREIEASTLQRLGVVYSSRHDISALTARKTIQCREWFGSFVPVIRYPSILEVSERLSTEFREAQLQTGQHEQRMLSEMFIEVFKALMSTEQPTETEVEDLISRVQKALAVADEKTEQDLYTDRIGSKLAEVMTLEKLGAAHQGSESERRVLRLYAQMLERRNDERQRAFARVRQFEGAVNKFLDEKELHISDERSALRRTSGAGVYIQTRDSRTYGLNSLSSGERQVLTMLFSATRMSSATGMFLIDEPELSLHVDWQRIILGELMTQAGGRQIVACTHSPEVGADHMDALQKFAPNVTTFELPIRPSESMDTSLDDTL
ncbi:AAA family ATPase [Delftia tsuruhatensis]|uniref:AAA family ATPase n=1 Tax=Delftia tsuruhatensis TaxID=180282 RepID=UPI00370C0478